MGMNSFIFLAVEAETIRTALLNTVMCISIVFILLFVFSWAISMFKYISKAESYFKNKNLSEPAPESEPEEAEEIYEEELSDDSELVAVITAAIYAYEQSMEAQSSKEIVIPADGLVVRSIRKVNKSGWQNA